MNKLFTLAACSLFSISAGAQITLTSASYSSFTPGSDNFRGMVDPGTPLSTNASWDLLTSTYSSGGFMTTKFAGTNASMPGATFYDDRSYFFSPGSPVAYDVKTWQGITPQAMGIVGETLDRQAFSLAPITGNSGDSLVFPAQDITYNEMRKNIAFPATAGSSWSSHLMFNTNFRVTATMYFLNQTPGYRRQHVIQRDTVAGWGRMRVLDANNNPTGWMDVLAVKSMVTTVDSYFLNNAPAPAMLLTAMGLQQGNTNSHYRTNFYRSGEVEPLLNIEYADATYSVIDEASVHTDRLPIPTAAATFQPAAGLRLYPNPVDANGSLRIELENEAAGTWQYVLRNAAGQQVAGNAVEITNGQGRIQLNQAPGQYFLSISKEGQQPTSRPVIIR